MVEGLSVVLPAYNEEGNIATAVNRALTVLPALARQFEVIVVNDGSRDRTGEVAQALAREHYPRVRLLHHVWNRGYGAALRTGFGHARHPLVFFTDSDNQFDLAELERFLPLMARYDLVTGFRIRRDDPALRLAVSWLYNRLVNVLFQLKVRDVNCAFKLFRRETLEATTLECDNFFASTELLAKARRANFRIAEQGVRHYPRLAGRTTVRPGDVPRTWREVFRMWRRVYFPARRGAPAGGEEQQRSDSENVVEFVPTGG